MYKHIVVPVDVEDSERGRAMLGEAKKLVGASGKVTVTYVVEDMPGLITEALPDGLVAEAARKARARLVEMAKAADVEAEVEVRSGRPHRAIAALAEEVGADLVLIASHAPGARAYLLGSTAAGVARHAKCSVLVRR